MRRERAAIERGLCESSKTRRGKESALQRPKQSATTSQRESLERNAPLVARKLQTFAQKVQPGSSCLVGNVILHEYHLFTVTSHSTLRRALHELVPSSMYCASFHPSYFRSGTASMTVSTFVAPTYVLVRTVSSCMLTLA
jgi:hypothetical protein